MASLCVRGERLDGANVGRPVAQEPADGRAERQARALDDRRRKREPNDVEIRTRDHGQPEQLGMPFWFVLPSAASANMVSRSCSNRRAGRTSHMNRTGSSPAFQKR